MLEIPGQLSAAESAASIYGGGAASASSAALRSSPGHAVNSSARVAREHRPLFSTAIRAPGVAAALRRDSAPSAGMSRIQMISNRGGSGEATDSGSSNSSSRNHRLSTAASYLRDASSDQSTVNSIKSRDSSKNRSRDSSPKLPRPRLVYKVFGI